jgi:4a-hydroxytetrahydrobiopterin dehydratase
MGDACDLSNKHCVPCEGGIPAMNTAEITQKLTLLKEWQFDQSSQLIFKRFEFKAYGKTMSFCNAVAWIANQENHHPDMLVGYNYCEVRFQTHAVKGLSENDFICAAKVDRLFD